MPIGILESLTERIGECQYQYNIDGQASRIHERYQSPDSESPMEFVVEL